MRFLSDENFDNDILRGLFARDSTLDILRVQDTEMFQASDPLILEWAAQQDRILLTHDKRTMPDYAYERLAAGLTMPGVIEISKSLSIGETVEELMYLMLAGRPEDFQNQVIYLPLR